MAIGTLCALWATGSADEVRWMASIGTVDGAGRIDVGRLVDALGWSPPLLLCSAVTPRRLVVEAAPETETADTTSRTGRAAGRGALRLDPLGRLRLPAGIRVRLGITAPGRALLAADAGAGHLVVASVAMLAPLLDALVEEVLI